MRGLDEEEAKFLDFVSDQQEKIEKNRETEEAEAINEYRVSFATKCSTNTQCTIVTVRIYGENYSDLNCVEQNLLVLKMLFSVETATLECLRCVSSALCNTAPYCDSYCYM